MPTYTATAPDGRKVSATGPTPPSEKEWDDIFSAVKAQPRAPFDVKASRDKLAAANRAYDANAALNAEQDKSMLGHIADQFTPDQIIARGIEGAKGYGEGLVGGAAGTVAAAVGLPLYALDKALHPIQTVQEAKSLLGTGATMAYMAARDPMETSNKIWDTFAQVASDPRNVGRAAGAYAGGRGVVESPLGQASAGAMKAIASATANKIPGVEAWRESRAAAQAAEAAAAAAENARPPVPVPSTVGPRAGGYGAPASDANVPGSLQPPNPPPPIPTPPPSPAAAANNVQAPAVFQPKPPTTPANTPPPVAVPREAPVEAPAPPSAAVRAAMPVIRGMTTEQWQAVAKLPVEERQLYLRLRQVGDSHSEAIRTLDYQRESQQLAEQAQNARAMVGKEKAASDLFGTSAPEAVRRIERLAPGPSRPPLAGLNAAMDARFKALLADPKAAWLLPLLGGAGLGALAQREK